MQVDEGDALALSNFTKSSNDTATYSYGSHVYSNDPMNIGYINVSTGSVDVNYAKANVGETGVIASSSSSVFYEIAQFTINASGDMYADAGLDSLKAIAYGSYDATLSIASSDGINVNAIGGSNANAYIGSIYAVDISGVYNEYTTFSAVTYHALVELNSDITVHASADEIASAKIGGIYALAAEGSGYASVTGTHDINISATATNSNSSGEAYAYMGLGAVDYKNSGYGYASISLGDINMYAYGGAYADAYLGMFAFGDNASLSINDITEKLTTTGGQVDLRFVAAAVNGASVSLGDLNFTVSADVSANLNSSSYIGIGLGVELTGSFIASAYTRLSELVTAQENIFVGDLNLNIASNFTAGVWIDNVYRDFTASASLLSSSANSVNLSGDGNIYLAFDDPDTPYAFIDASGLAGTLNLNMAIVGDDTDNAEIGDNFTVIKGFDISSDHIYYGDRYISKSMESLHNDSDVYNSTGDISLLLSSSISAITTSYSNTTSLISALEDSLDGDIQLAYAKYTGSSITLNGMDINTSTGSWYAVAYDEDGIGITSLLMVQTDDTLDKSNFV